MEMWEIPVRKTYVPVFEVPVYRYERSRPKTKVMSSYVFVTVGNAVLALIVASYCKARPDSRPPRG